MVVSEFRRRLLDLLNEAYPIEDPDDDPDDQLPAAAVCTAAAVMVEWEGDDGHRWLSRSGALGSGQPAPPWILEMLYHEGEAWDHSD